ncbi:hypothetical protein [Bacillus thuringiensis]|uniref:hypothetical protein n=1 Tax=Bacillus thuringiensis TaxID=1428 RepID=UPI001CFBF217|nr:hypothetical protein [Bacillus thuringiensis]
MDSKRWSNRDWFWLVGILLMAIIFLVAKVFDYVNIEANFSIISSAVSIALAVIAIVIALKQDSDNQRVNAQVSRALSEISMNVKSVDDKLKNSINRVGKETADEYSQEIGKQDTYTKEEVDEILNKFSKDVTSNINVILDQNSSYKGKSTFYDLPENLMERVANTIRNNKHLEIRHLQSYIEEKYGVLLAYDIIKVIRDTEN